MASLLDPEFLAQLEYLYVVAKERFLTRTNAQRASKSFGSGLEYADHRDYVPGDDIRYVDWQVYARLNRFVIKLFTEEQELSIYLLLDVSASMARGTPSKALFAKQVLGALGYIGLSNLDRVIVVPLGQEMRRASVPMTGNGRRLELLRFLDDLEVEGTTDLHRSVQGFVSRYTQRGLVVFASDFFDPSYPKALRLLHHHGFDCLVLQVNEREERTPAMSGDVELVDCESGEAVPVRLTPRMRELYEGTWNTHYGELRRLCRAFQHGHFAAISDESLKELVFGIFRRSGFLR